MIQHPLNQYRLLIFDADGTLRRCTVPGQPCPNRPGEWELLPNVRETLRLYDWTQTAWGIVSNQGGVALGYLSEPQAYRLLYDLSRACDLPEIDRERHQPSLDERRIFWEAAGIGITGVERHQPSRNECRLCPHAPQDDCPCRKPSPLLVLELVQDVRRVRFPNLRVGEVIFVGDQSSDQEAAQRAGVAFCWADEFFGWSDPDPVYEPVL